MKIITIIPAREGSKRLKHKNIYPLKGKPLIEYTIEAALNSKYIDVENLYISTDFKKVVEIAINRNLNVHIRPKILAGDKIWTQDVIDEVIKNIPLEEDDLIIILQANSPQMTSYFKY